MSHPRKDIRDAVVTLLKNGSTDAGQSVFPNRESAVWVAELPSICVYTKEETAEPRDIRSRQYIRTISLVIECKRQATSLVDDDLDTICSQVEGILSADTTGLTGTALSSVYKGTSMLIDDSNSEANIGVATLNYEVQYIY